MPNSMTLSLEQHQRLLITPELRQAIALLELPTLELTQWVEAELAENPLLELADGTADPEAAWAEYLQGSPPPRSGPRPEEEQEEPQWVASVSLQEHLLLQLAALPLPKAVHRAAVFIVGSLDEDGYLRTPLGEISLQLEVDAATVDTALRAVQSLDPLGVAARSLSEALLLQWRARNEPYPLLEALLENHLEAVAQGRMADLARLLNVSVPEVQAAVAGLRSLEPRPARSFAPPGEVLYVVPDLTVERAPSGFRVVVNDYPLPLLRFNSFYRRLLAQPPDQETRSYLRRKFHAALWVMQSLERRRQTLQQIMEAIVELQLPFFERGVQHLRPLTLRQVATRVAVHESTVCRVVANKYVQTPRGLLPLRSFFTHGLPSASGEPVTPEQIKRDLQRLVDAEDARRPLSDQALAEELNRAGYCIRRRTVTKYRESLGILPSARRRTDSA
ncbi:MAG: RNA polymerase factor sigma-54 [Thermaerobacter sp.]|nr:RNA polymerase factor sigma-54 [Thermaerobacter sp.]